MVIVKTQPLAIYNENCNIFKKTCTKKGANSSHSRGWNIIISCLNRSFTLREFIGATATTMEYE
jgi:hypothetical protein